MQLDIDAPNPLTAPVVAPCAARSPTDASAMAATVFSITGIGIAMHADAAPATEPTAAPIAKLFAYFLTFIPFLMESRPIVLETP